MSTRKNPQPNPSRHSTSDMLARLSAELVVLRARVTMLETLATTRQVPPTPGTNDWFQQPPSGSRVVPRSSSLAPSDMYFWNPAHHRHAHAGF